MNPVPFHSNLNEPGLRLSKICCLTQHGCGWKGRPRLFLKQTSPGETGKLGQAAICDTIHKITYILKIGRG